MGSPTAVENGLSALRKLDECVKRQIDLTAIQVAEVEGDTDAGKHYVHRA